MNFILPDSSFVKLHLFSLGIAVKSRSLHFTCLLETLTLILTESPCICLTFKYLSDTKHLRVGLSSTSPSIMAKAPQPEEPTWPWPNCFLRRREVMQQIRQEFLNSDFLFPSVWIFSRFSKPSKNQLRGKCWTQAGTEDRIEGRRHQDGKTKQWVTFADNESSVAESRKPPVCSQPILVQSVHRLWFGCVQMQYAAYKWWWREYSNSMFFFWIEATFPLAARHWFPCWVSNGHAVWLIFTRSSHFYTYFWLFIQLWVLGGKKIRGHLLFSGMSLFHLFSPIWQNV